MFTKNLFARSLAQKLGNRSVLVPLALAFSIIFFIAFIYWWNHRLPG